MIVNLSVYSYRTNLEALKTKNLSRQLNQLYFSHNMWK
ncbi:hypothetical protein A33Q_1022 [Indibacter alkaliphilus LW1]|uniref:Uncharacterized protein n=1 Tax=Indibacter alkaliphilus (strain CCUG 57479 / KCTC 22604 / LW1) TaxID=1189612 RepID=S2E7V9_INDAL|nr:hypothetical protein A33Q_1022 [Indibacter alkaliphilus LW1]